MMYTEFGITLWKRIRITSFPLSLSVAITMLMAAMTTAAVAQVWTGANGRPNPSSPEDSVTIAAGARYSAGPMKRLLLGRDYRDLWTTPIRVPVLDPDAFAGGLVVDRRGGGTQTVSLRFVAPDGRQYLFRSVDKRQEGGLHEDLHGTIISDIIQDQVSSKHPGGAVVVAPLLEAAGVLHVNPTLVVMADVPSLGEFRDEFAGMLGTIEERPNEPEATLNGSGGVVRIIGTERLLERIEASAADRPVPRAYARARLMDLLVGDWDRHRDQWRWLQYDSAGVRYWLPIPRDRDNAFSRVDGFAAVVGGFFRSNVVAFDDDILDDLDALTYNAAELDRRLLAGLSREEWASIATDLQQRLTDDVIADAVARLPDPWQEMNAEFLEDRLRSRRDELPAVADAFHARLSRAVDVRLTAGDDHVIAEYLPDGRLALRVFPVDDVGPPLFDRIFDPAETGEVRVHLGDGDDQVEVTGPGGPVRLRIIGGEGNDRYESGLTSETASSDLVVHDENVGRVRGPIGELRNPPAGMRRAIQRTFDNNPAPPQDWGTDFSWVDLSVGWASQFGPLVGVGPSYVRYGFDRQPYAESIQLKFLYAPYRTRFGLRADAHLVQTSRKGEAELSAWATQLDVTRFYGFGNDSEELDDSDLTRIWANRFGGSAFLTRTFAPGFRFGVGPTADHVRPDWPEERIDRPRGSEPFTVAGLAIYGTVDRRDSPVFPRRGLLVELESAAYPLTWGDADETFARGGLTISGYLPLPKEMVLAGRVGGEIASREAPVQFAAHLGGSSSLRGYRGDRFTGDASLFTGLDLRVPLGGLNLRLIRTHIGVIGFSDVGRVFIDEPESKSWHLGYGGGLWAAALDRSVTAHVLLQSGEGLRVSAGLGFPF